MAVKSSNAQYTTGSVTKSQSQLNNNMSGTDANAIYYATHGGSAGTNYSAGNSQATNPGSYVTYTPAPSTNTSSSYSGSSGSSSGGSYSGGLGNGLSSGARGSIGGGIGGGESGGAGYDYMSMIQSMLAQQRAAAESAYNNSKARLDAALDSTKSALSSNLSSTLENLQRQYDYGSNKMNDDAGKSLREAYVNYMLNKKNMNQNLSAAGVSGGATESSLAKLYNNYGNSRNSINTTLAENIAELLNQYQNNVSTANQAYNSQYADMMNNYAANLSGLETALASNLMSSYSGSSLSSLANFAATLNGLSGAMNTAANTYTPTQNSLAVDNITSRQANDSGTVTDYAKYLAMVDGMRNQGMSQTSMIQNLYNSGASARDVLRVLGGN